MHIGLLKVDFARSSSQQISRWLAKEAALNETTFVAGTLPQDDAKLAAGNVVSLSSQWPPSQPQIECLNCKRIEPNFRCDKEQNRQKVNFQRFVSPSRVVLTDNSKLIEIPLCGTLQVIQMIIPATWDKNQGVSLELFDSLNTVNITTHSFVVPDLNLRSGKDVNQILNSIFLGNNFTPQVSIQ
jgi:hypothetical protein